MLITPQLFLPLAHENFDFLGVPVIQTRLTRAAKLEGLTHFPFTSFPAPILRRPLSAQA